MSTIIQDQTLDAILAVQITIAWTGEGRRSPRRLGSWETDLIDEAGGGDFLPRIDAWMAAQVKGTGAPGQPATKPKVSTRKGGSRR